MRGLWRCINGNTVEHITLFAATLGQKIGNQSIALSYNYNAVPTNSPSSYEEWMNFGNSIVLQLIAQAKLNPRFNPSYPFFINGEFDCWYEYNQKACQGFSISGTIPQNATSANINPMWSMPTIGVIIPNLASAKIINGPADVIQQVDIDNDVVYISPAVIGKFFSLLITFADGSSVVCTNSPPPIDMVIKMSGDGITITITGGSIGNNAFLQSASTIYGPWTHEVSINLTGTNTISLNRDTHRSTTLFRVVY